MYLTYFLRILTDETNSSEFERQYSFCCCAQSVQFDVVFHPALVNCFVTFIPSVETWNVGPTDGLSLILFLDHMKWGEDALPNAAEPFTPQLETHAAGVKLQLTAATDKPMWGLHSTLLNPGETTTTN